MTKENLDGGKATIQISSQTVKHREPRLATLARWLALGLALVLGATCASPPQPSRQEPAVSAPQQPAVSAPQQTDFNLVAYQGEEALGGPEGAFSRVLQQGKPVVLNFWAGQCPPCRAEMPEFQRVADDFEGRVVFVGIDIGAFTGLGSHDDAQRVLQDLGVRYPTAYAVDASPVEIYRLASMPSTFFLRPNGEVASKRPGALPESELRREVEKLIGA